MNTNKHKLLMLCVLCVLCGSARAPTMIMPAFNGGEWAPKLDGRQDVRKYYSSARMVENLVALPEGPVTKRPGTYYIGQAAGPARLIRFEHGTQAARILEFGDKTMRVFQ